MGQGVLTVVQNCGGNYNGYQNEVGKNLSYFLSIDSCTEGILNNPIRIPEEGKAYSYEVYIRTRLDVAPLVYIRDIKVWYTAGLPSIGQKITVNSDTIADYEMPVNIESSRGSRIDFTTKTSSANAISLDGNLTAIGQYSSWLVFQLELLPTADINIFELDYIIQYDES